MTLQDVIKAHVIDRFYANNGNYTYTAKELGVGIRTLRGWLNEDLWPYDHCTRAERRDAKKKSVRNTTTPSSPSLHRRRVQSKATR